MSPAGVARILLLVACVLLSGCKGAEDDGADARPIVIVSVLPQAYFVERIAGDLVDVEVMIPPGAGETYEPTMAQIASASDASLYVKVGHPSFPFERQWLDRIVGQDVPVVDASAGSSRREGDPHVWVSPASARTMANNIAGALSELLPDEQATIDANRATLVDDIDALDADVRAMLAPHEGKRFFVLHPAWGYFAADYGLEQMAVEHEHKEPSPAHLMELIEEARESGAQIVLVQPQFPKRQAEMIADEIGARVVEADPLARDWLSNTRRVAELLAEGFGS